MLRERPRTGLADERGSVTAEFATVLPAALAIVVVVLGGFQLLVQQLRVADAAFTSARLLARSDDSAAGQAVVDLLGADARLERVDEGRFACAVVTAQADFAPAQLVGIELTSRSCSLASGE
jgi:Flp pilus assembly protein TadG